MKRRRLTVITTALGAAGLAFSVSVACVRGAQTPSSAAAAREAKAAPVSWKQILRQPDAWYGSDEAVRIADNVLLYQRDTGGWNKNIDMTPVLSQKEQDELRRQKREPESTIDNGATFTQAAYLARVYTATKQDRFKNGFLKGLDYLLAAQYENGGWPQYYPLRKGYYSHITFNDNAMIGVLNLLRDIVRKEPAYAFVDESRRARSEQAITRGIDCILKSQIIVNGKRTVWCAQHDEKTLAPAPARAYEKVSLSGNESVGIVRFLMGIERPGAAVKEAIQSAITWFQSAQISGIKVVEKPDASLPDGFDRVVVADPAAPPLWARFYEIGTNRPIFSGRDGIIKYRLADIEPERRTGYAWYSASAGPLLQNDYPAWKKKTSGGAGKTGR